MRIGFVAAVVGTLLAMSISDSVADKRVALVIGNSAYRTVANLPNPGNDAAAMASLFKNSGFDVVEVRRDVVSSDLRRALREFSAAVRNADIAVVYYAGHGIEVDGTNYLIPIDAKLESDVDVEDEAVSLDRVLKILEPVKRLRLVILDACRENPFAKTMKRTIGTRSVGRGLAQVEPSSSNTLIAFAARAGSLASDGDGASANSPFTTALTKYIASPGVDLRIAFGQVRDDVMKATNYRQEPFVYGSLGGATLALVPPPEPKRVDTPAPAPGASQAADVRRDYELAERIGTKEAWDSYLAVQSTGLYADLARAARAKLVATEQAKAQSEERARRQAEEQAKRQAAEEAKRQAAEGSRLKVAEDARLKGMEEARRNAETEQAKLKAAEETRLKAAEDARRKAEEQAKRETTEHTTAPIVVATAPNPPAPEDARKPAGPVLENADLGRLLQAHLKRVGCDPGTNDGGWSDGSRRALELFNKHAGTKFDVKLASLDALDAVRSKGARVCPLVCAKGFRADGERCLEVGCKAGLVRDSDGDCIRKEAPKAAAPPHERTRPREAPARDASPAQPSQGGQSGQISCSNRGCQPVAKNCHTVKAGSPSHPQELVVCN